MHRQAGAYARVFLKTVARATAVVHPMAEPSWIPLVAVDGGGLLSGSSVTVNDEACSLLAAESPVPSKLALVALDGAQVAGALVGAEPPPPPSSSTATIWLWTKPLRKLPPASPSPTIMAIEVRCHCYVRVALCPLAAVLLPLFPTP